MEDDQQFCLRWNNHQSTLIQNFDTLLESGTLVDCTLAAEGKYLKAHKVVLSACSPYFEGLLSEHYDKHPVFILKDVKFKELKAMMDYMYRGEVNISQDQLAALLKAAESLQIKGLSESKTGGGSKTESRPQQKVMPQPIAPSLDIPHASSGLTIEKNKVPRQGIAQGSVGDLPEDSASPQVPKRLPSREGSQSPTSRKRKRFRRGSVGEDISVENHEASNSSDMPQQIGVPALGIAPVADEKAHADPTDSLGRSALMTQLTKPADEMLQLPLEKSEPNDSLIEPKSEYLDDPEESVEDLTLDDDMNDLNEMEQDNNRAGPSHDPSQHPAGLGGWHVTGDRSNAGGVVGSVAGGGPGTTDEVFLAAQEAAQAHRDSQGEAAQYPTVGFKHTCITCGKTYKHKHHLKRHHDFECGIDPKFQCAFCPHRTRYKDSLMKHILARHQHVLEQNSQFGPHQQMFELSPGDLESSLHAPGSTYSSANRTIPVLPSTSGRVPVHTRRLRSMTDHTARWGPRKYLCSDCSKTFSLKASLVRHKIYECNKLGTPNEKSMQLSPNGDRSRTKKKHVCPKWFRNVRQINRFPRKRTIRNPTESPIKCPQCGRTYKMKRNLTTHMKFECGGQRNFTCHVCPAKYTQNISLRRHLLQRHNIYLPPKFTVPKRIILS